MMSRVSFQFGPFRIAWYNPCRLAKQLKKSTSALSEKGELNLCLSLGESQRLRGAVGSLVGAGFLTLRRLGFWPSELLYLPAAIVARTVPPAAVEKSSRTIRFRF